MRWKSISRTSWNIRVEQNKFEESFLVPLIYSKLKEKTTFLPVCNKPNKSNSMSSLVN